MNKVLLVSINNITYRSQCHGMPLKECNFGTIKEDVLPHFSMEPSLAELYLHDVARVLYHLDDDRVEQATNKSNDPLKYVDTEWPNHPFP